MRGSLLHYHAVLHENGLGGNIAGKAHLVGDHQHGHALFGQLPHHGQHFASQLRVKGRSRLVKIDDLRVRCQRTGNGHALLLAAGKLARIVVGSVGKAHLFQHLHANGIRLLFGHFAGNDEALGHVLQGSLVAEQIVALEHKGRLFAQPGNVGAAGLGKVERLAVKGELACVGSLQKVQTAQQGGLTGAGGAEDGHYIALFHGQVHAAQHLQLAGHFACAGPVEDACLQAGLCVGEKGFVDVFDL